MSETWVWNRIVSIGFTDSWSYDIAFTSNGISFSSISASPKNLEPRLLYDSKVVAGGDRRGSQVVFRGEDEVYETIIFSEPPTGDLLTLLQANATKQSTGGVLA